MYRKQIGQELCFMVASFTHDLNNTFIAHAQKAEEDLYF